MKLIQGPVVAYKTTTNEIQIDLYFLPPGLAPQQTRVTNQTTQQIISHLDTPKAGAYDVTATSYFNDQLNSSLSTKMMASPVPVPAALWLFLSRIVP